MCGLVTVPLILCGCAEPGPQPGSVLVQIGVGDYSNGQTEFPVVVRDGDGAVVYDEVLKAGMTIVVEDVAPGDVTVVIEDQCEVGGQVDGWQLAARVEPGHCILG